jgi:F-type H+-transporting ATPase subunit gamma
MASLRDIRDRIVSVNNTQQVTRAMKMVSAAKLRRAQEAIFRTRPYSFRMSEVISHLKKYVDPGMHRLFQEREEKNAVLVVVVTADRGLAGAFNTNIIKLAEKTISDQFGRQQAAGNLFLLCVGRKGHDHFKNRGYQLIGDFRGAFDKVDFSTAAKVVAVAEEGYVAGRWDEVHVVYNEFKNTIAQNRIVEQLLPILPSLFLTPVMESEMDHLASSKEGEAVDFIFEPDAVTILDVLAPRYIRQNIWRILLESNASEQGARMVAMDSATTNADELLKALRLKYNRARQDAITKELIEITSGADALS